MDALTYATGARRLLSAILLQALRDARKPHGWDAKEARQWIIDGATEITTALWGFGVDGLYLLDLLDRGLLDHIIHYTPQRYARPVHRTDRQQIQPLPDHLTDRLWRVYRLCR